MEKLKEKLNLKIIIPIILVIIAIIVVVILFFNNRELQLLGVYQFSYGDTSCSYRFTKEGNKNGTCKQIYKIGDYDRTITLYYKTKKVDKDTYKITFEYEDSDSTYEATYKANEEVIKDDTYNDFIYKKK